MASKTPSPQKPSDGEEPVATDHHCATPCPHCGYRECPNCGHPIHPDHHWYPDWPYYPWWRQPYITWGTQTVTMGSTTSTLPGGTIFIMN